MSYSSYSIKSQSLIRKIFKIFKLSVAIILKVKIKDRLRGHQKYPFLLPFNHASQSYFLFQSSISTKQIFFSKPPLYFAFSSWILRTSSQVVFFCFIIPLSTSKMSANSSKSSLSINSFTSSVNLLTLTILLHQYHSNYPIVLSAMQIYMWFVNTIIITLIYKLLQIIIHFNMYQIFYKSYYTY